MFYRISCVTRDGDMRGHQWREFSQDDFVQIAQGRRVLADPTAQILNSSSIDASFDDGPVYFQHVWTDEGWRDDLTLEQAIDLYQKSGQPTAGG